jgi:hypothetical protein
MHTELGRREASVRERLDSPLDDACSGSAPARMQKSGSARRVHDEDRDTVCDADSEGEAAIEGDMSVSRVDAQPTLPAGAVDDDPRAMDLGRRSEPSSAGRQLLPQHTPALHHVTGRLG